MMHNISHNMPQYNTGMYPNNPNMPNMYHPPTNYMLPLNMLPNNFNPNQMHYNMPPNYPDSGFNKQN